MSNHILIIDDTWINRELYKEFLVSYGYRVSMAKDGLEGLEMAFTVKPDLIILDMQLPKIPGDKVYELLKNDGLTEKIPILIISAYNSPAEIKKKCKNISWEDIYIKPINHKQIKEKIDSILEKEIHEVEQEIHG